jgi:predicted PurR-regulated permease PerM
MAVRHTNSYGWWLLAVLVIAALLLRLLGTILLPFVFATALAYIGSPLVGWLQRRLHAPRALIVALLYILVLGPLIAAGYFLGPSALGGVERYIAAFPDQLAKYIAQMLGGQEVQFFGRAVSANQLAQEILSGIESLVATPGDIVHFASLGVEAFIGVILALVVSFYFLLGGGSLSNRLLGLVPAMRRPQVRYLGERIDHMLGRYIRGLAVILVTATIIAWIGLGLIFHVPGALPVSFATGILEPVPVIGPVTAWIIVSLYAYVNGGFILMLKVMVVLGVLRLTLDNILGPIILGKAVTLHPVAILFAFLAGGTLFGIVGILLAVPIAASLKVILENWEASAEAE